MTSPIGSISSMTATPAITGGELVPCVYSGVVANYTFNINQFAASAIFTGGIQTYLLALPTTLPAASGQLWWNGGLLAKS